MSVVVEILLELFLEGALECGTDPQVPRWIRILACLLLGMFTAAGVLLVVSLVVSCSMDGRFAAAAVVGGIGVGVLGLLIWAVCKKCKEHHCE
ncbi:MAG: hypothetical protein IJC75_03710 [Oscillospiraceae bacterium]|nr:hypothetical protein [Oscillospiraceae bacterium]